MIILIPLGGIGKRFKDLNYKLPKPLINVMGKPIIFWLLDNINYENVNLVYIPYNYELSKYMFEERILNRYSNINFKFFKLEEDTRGAAETVLISLNRLNLIDQEIICLDGDNFYIYDIVSEWKGKNVVSIFKDFSNEEIFSYVKLNNSLDVIEIKEKNKISNNACSGAYGFNSWRQLKNYCKRVIDMNIKQKNEFYISAVIQEMINDKIKFGIINVPNDKLICLGTPLQARLFCNNFPIFNAINNKKVLESNRYCFDLDNTLVTYPKITNDYSSVEPIKKTIDFVRYLKNLGHTIIIHTARRMKTHNGNLGSVIADIGKVTFDTLEKFNIPYDEIYFGKPYANFYIDDNAVCAFDNLEKELGFYLDSIKPRDFNSVEKTSIEVFTKRSNNLSGEIYYYSNIPNEIKDMFPLFIDYDIDNKWYTIEKIGGLTLSNLYLSELLSKNTLLAIMKSIKRIQNVKITNNQNINIYQNYKDKLKKRYDNYDYSKYPNSFQIYKIIYEKLENYENKNMGKISCIHGDTVFTNILINEYEKIKFIDMRGQLGDKLTIYGDWLYDWAKFYQSLIGYDEILLDKEINLQYKTNMINYFEETFINWFSKNQLNYLKIITNSLLFTLIPLHNNDKCSKYYNLIKI